MTTAIKIGSTLMNEQQKKEARIAGWFKDYGKRLLRFVRSRVRDLEEAEDLSQEVWYQLSRQADLDAIDQIGNWLFTVADNKVLNSYKKKKTVSFSSLEPSAAEDEDGAEMVENELFFNEWIEYHLPDEVLESAQFWDKFNRALDKLPVDQRTVFIANEMEDVSFREMAEQTGISINTLMARKRYAVLSLRKEFADWI